MKNRAVQYIPIILIITAVAGSYFYYQSRAAMTVNKSGVSSVKINSSQAGMLTSGLVGYWTFDGQDTNWGANTTDDVSTNSNIGTMTNMSTTTSPVPGVAGRGLNFYGSDDYVGGGTHAGL